MFFRDPFPRIFNPCNQKELKRYLSSGGGKCLFNPPNTRVMYGGQRCGNGYLEEGEECDCGEEEVRREFHCFLDLVCSHAVIPIDLSLSYFPFLFPLLQRSAQVPVVMPTTARWRLERSAHMEFAVMSARWIPARLISHFLSTPFPVMLHQENCKSNQIKLFKEV